MWSQKPVSALGKGIVNIERHLRNITEHYGLPCVVPVNHFTADTDAEVALLKGRVEALGGRFVVAHHCAEGGRGAEELAHAVVDLAQGFHGRRQFVYEDSDTLQDKITAIATKIYSAGQVTFAEAARQQLDAWSADYGHFPVCMAKTQMSFSADPSVRDAPTSARLPASAARRRRG